jgi:molybdate transport system ATP-binding protein
MVMADRLVVVEGGRVVQHGRPADVARRPATDYVARLVGLNLLAGVAESGGHVRLDEGGSVQGHGAQSPGARVLVAVPPSAVSLLTTEPGPGSARNVWPGVVDGLEPLHDRVRVHVEARPSLLVDVTAAAVAELGLRPGSTVWLSVKATEVEVYPEPARTAEPA